MNISNSISTKWIIGILAIMNIALLSFILMAPGTAKNNTDGEIRSEKKSERTSKFLQKKLGFTDEETAVIKDLQTIHFKAKKEKYKNIKILKKEMFTALNLETPDSSKAKTIANQIGEEYQLIEEMMINHYLTLKTKCTSPEQLQKLEQIFERIITRDKSHGKSHKKGSGKGCK